MSIPGCCLEDAISPGGGVPDDGAAAADEAKEAAEDFATLAQLAEQAQHEEFIELPSLDRLESDEEEEEMEGEVEEEKEHTEEEPHQKEHEEFASRMRNELTEEKHVRKMNITPLRNLCRGLKITHTGDKKALTERIINKLRLRPDFKAMYEVEKPTFKCKQDLVKGISVSFLRFMCTEEDIRTEDDEGNNVPRAKLEAALAAKLGLPAKRPPQQKPFNEKVKMNLHRLNQLLFYMFFRWDGVKWGGSSIRGEVIERVKAKYGTQLSDEEAIRMASNKSSYFSGLWCCFEMELRMCVEPFMDWERGDITAFLRLFPLMCMYVASSHKSKVPKVFLMLAERLKLYKVKHPNVMKLFASNCIQFDEEKIEFMNARIGRFLFVCVLGSFDPQHVCSPLVNTFARCYMAVCHRK